MKTVQQPFTIVENEFLENILRQMVNQYTIVQLFYNKATAVTAAQLIILLDKKADADALQSAKWVAKAQSRYGIRVHCMYATRLHHQHTLGHPFIEAYCRPSAVLYQNETCGNPLHINRRWKKYNKKFRDFKEHFYAERERQREMVEALISENAANSAWLAYQRLLEYDLNYLTELYTGNRPSASGLDEKINGLVSYVPEIQQYFVKKSANTYYLAGLFAKAAEATDQEELVYETDLFGAIGTSEKGLFQLVEQQLAVLKRLIKKAQPEKHETVVPVGPKEEALERAVATLSCCAGVEQVYCYHKSTYGDQKIHYLLIIANGLGNEKLKELTQSLNDRAGGQQQWMLVSHSRYWIQKNLYQYQSFFKPIIEKGQLVYASNAYHPSLHWEVPHQPYHADLYFYYTATSQAAGQLSTIIGHSTGNYQGIAYLFTLFFRSFCHTCIYIKTYYLPNDLSGLALWQLCLYADPRLQKFEYLFGQFPVPLFPYLDTHTVLRRLSNPTKVQADQMGIMAGKLMQALDGLVVEAGLSETVGQKYSDE